MGGGSGQSMTANVLCETAGRAGMPCSKTAEVMKSSAGEMPCSKTAVVTKNSAGEMPCSKTAVVMKNSAGEMPCSKTALSRGGVGIRHACRVQNFADHLGWQLHHFQSLHVHEDGWKQVYMY